MLSGKRPYENNLTLKIVDAEIKWDEVVKLLNIYIDYQLNFNFHISNLCREAGQLLDVLKRLSPYLSKLNKLTIFHTFLLSIIIVFKHGIFALKRTHKNRKRFKKELCDLCMMILIELMKNC